jgi:hypothetical protein
MIQCRGNSSFSDLSEAAGTCHRRETSPWINRSQPEKLEQFMQWGNLWEYEPKKGFSNGREKDADAVKSG